MLYDIVYYFDTSNLGLIVTFVKVTSSEKCETVKMSACSMREP